MNIENPLIVQGDRTLLLDVHSPLFDECRNALIPFAELVKSPEHFHTYRLSSLSLWNAASAGFSADDAVAVLEKYARYDIPQSVSFWIHDTAERFGKVRLIQGLLTEDANDALLYLVTDSERIYKEIAYSGSLKKVLKPSAVPSGIDVSLTENERRFCFSLSLTDRGTVKQLLLSLNLPVKDEIALLNGEPLDISLRDTTLHNKPFCIRDYQKNAAAALIGDKGPGTGFGTIVLPCGAGKTIVGMQIMDLLKTSTLIITTNISAVHQWIEELLDKTTLQKEQVSEYSGESKTIQPVTVATYQVLTWRPDKEGPYPHFSLFHQRHWGLIIYDEVHMLPAPVFRVVAELQAVRRVGLTATLVREDGCEGYVFSLVGPKRYDVPWKELERENWIASAECIEVRIPLSEEKDAEYAVSPPRQKNRIASENVAKNAVVRQIVDNNPDDKILVIGQYINQLEEIAAMLNAPIITGKVPSLERDKIYSEFRNGNIRVLVVSKVANFAIDLPDASLAIQVSGTFGSRQEEAQRLGRILRPKERTSRFYTLITRNTVEEDFGANRQKFLAEQGYSYRIVRYSEGCEL